MPSRGGSILASAEEVATYSAGRLFSVNFADGRSELFAYHPDGKLASITELGVGGAASRTWEYTWEGDDLVRLDRSDGTAWEFFYEDAAHPGYMTRMDLVGTDDSRRVETAWEYDARGNVIKLWRGDESFDGPEAVEKWSFSFDNPRPGCHPFPPGALPRHPAPQPPGSPAPFPRVPGMDRISLQEHPSSARPFERRPGNQGRDHIHHG